MRTGGLRPGGYRVRRWIHLTLACVAALAVIALAGCGSSSSKPAYCTDRANLQKAIKNVGNLSPSSPISTLAANLENVQTQASAAVSSAKGDFPTQTGAMKSSVATLTADVTALPSNPSVTQIATIVTDAKAVVSAVKSFIDATGSKCA
jgi:hypothetical protein